MFDVRFERRRTSTHHDERAVERGDGACDACDASHERRGGIQPETLRQVTRGPPSRAILQPSADDGAPTHRRARGEHR